MAKKALTKEDLLYILQEVFRISDKANNGVTILENGLYSEDYHNDLESHTNNEDIHINKFIKDMLLNFSLDENGNIYYNNKIINIELSNNPSNALQQSNDGLFVNDYSNEIQIFESHVSDTDIHVTIQDKENWNKTLQEAKDFIINKIAELVFYDFEVVSLLPDKENVIPSRLYLLENDVECPTDLEYSAYIHVRDEWKRLTLSKTFLESLATKEELKDYALKSQMHSHNNKEILDKFEEDKNGNIIYNKADIIMISNNPNNAAQLIDGKLFVTDYKDTINSLVTTQGFVKFNLLNQECTESGVYELKGFIEDFNLLLVEYYYKPNDGDDDLNPGNAKTMMLDVDSVRDLYTQGYDILLDLGYGVSAANSKIRMNKDKLWVNYYHGCCVYKITGIKGGGTLNE